MQTNEPGPVKPGEGLEAELQWIDAAWEAMVVKPNSKSTCCLFPQATSGSTKEPLVG